MVPTSRLIEAVTAAVGTRPVVVAVSGGADSAALAWAVREAGLPGRAVHVHHGQPASDDLAAAAAAVCGVIGLDLTTVSVDVPATGSFETQARERRYAALLGEMKPDEVLLLGHTLDDQAETVLIQLARGAGPTGAAAMRSERDTLVRPLLDLRRAAVRQVADQMGLPFLDDPANLDKAHTRVAVRHDVLPGLETAQPGAIESLARHASLAGALEDLLDFEAAHLVGGTLPVAVYLTLPTAMRPRVLRLLARLSGCRPSGPSLERMHQVAVGDSRAIEIGEGWEFVRDGPAVSVRRSCPVPASPEELESGATRWGAWRFAVRDCDDRPSAFPLGPDRAIVPALGQLVVRALRREDRFGDRPAWDALAGVSSASRRAWPAIQLDGELVWIPGLRRMDAGWLRPEDQGYRWLAADRRDVWTSERP